MEIGKVYKTDVRMKRTRTTKWIKMARIATCNHWQVFELVKNQLKKALANHFADTTVNVTLTEDEFEKFLVLANEQAWNVEITALEMDIVRQIKVFINTED